MDKTCLQRCQEGIWLAGPDTWKQKMAQCRLSPTTEEVIVGLCHQRGNIRARKRRWEPCTSREVGVLWLREPGSAKDPEAEGLAHLGNREEGRTERVASGMRVMWSSNLWLSFLPDGHWRGLLWPPTQDGLRNKGRSREVGDKTGFRPSGHRAGAGEPGGCLWNQTR